MITLVDLAVAGLWPIIACRNCGRTVEGNARELTRVYGANYQLTAYLERLRCSKCGVVPDVALRWEGASGRGSGVLHVRWQLIKCV